MQQSTEEVIFWGVGFALVVSLIIFFMFYSNFSAAFPVGCNNNNICENQFTSAEYGYPNRMEGTSLFRCYLTDCCYNQATANTTCVEHWCYYLNKGDPVASQNCIASPNATVAQNCYNSISSTNTAALESCQDSTHLANNATMIENCDISNPVCLPGDSKYCSSCSGS